MVTFMAGLLDPIATRILEMFPGPRNLFALQTIATRIGSRLSAHRNFFRQRNLTNNNPPNNTKFNPKRNTPSNFKNKLYGPLSKEKERRRRRENLCEY